jgi:tryptophan halogenase
MKIIIVGGGSAGWLTAFGFSTSRPQHQYYVIDSSVIGTIGVGEGTTGKFHDFAHSRGISKLELIKGCNALPKYGIKFFNWRNDGKDYISPVEGSTTGHKQIDWSIYATLALDKPLYYPSKGALAVHLGKSDYMLSDQGLNEVFDGIFPLHVDNVATGEFFKRKCLEHNVTHIDSRVLQVNKDSINGNIVSLVLENGQSINGDLFIDCSGFSQLLIKEMKPDWIDYSKFLPVNSAIPFALIGDDSSKNTYTTARAMSAGWMWEIPSRNQIGRGYIYDDRFTTEEQALDEVEKLFGKEIKKVKSIKFKTGRLEKPWIKNCVAIGLSAAFLEPLQATSIHCAIAQIEDFITTCLDETLDQTLNPVSMKLYNQRISDLYSCMADFISLHYTGGKSDSDFWKYVSNEVSPTDKVKEIIELAKSRGTRYSDFETKEFHAGQPIWNFTLAGLGHLKKDVAIRIINNFSLDMQGVYMDLENMYNLHKFRLENSFGINELNNLLKVSNNL